MSRPTDPELRQRILEACYQVILESRRLDLSINELGKLAGTSGRMLVYHFESKDKLDALLISMIEQNFRDEFIAFADRHAARDRFLVQFWDHMTQDPHRLALMRLAYEVTCYIAHHSHFKRLVTTEVGSWLAILAKRFGSDENALLVLLLFQGAIVDLSMTGDPAPGRLAMETLHSLLSQGCDDDKR